MAIKYNKIIFSIFLGFVLLLTAGCADTGQELHEPISSALTRITKKTFGLKVSPLNSPVTPEKFSGYHTGVDFETTPNEQNTDVSIYAVCAGSVILKKWASGYGGVLVQQCTLEGRNVTIIFGHIKLSSINSEVGQILAPGDLIGVLGKAKSNETDGERKHLHLGIHKGTDVNIRGYVQSESELGDWIDAQKYL